MPTAFQAFANDSQSLTFDDLTLENQGEQVNLYGSATFRVDEHSLQVAKQLQTVINDIVQYLDSHHAADIPATATTAKLQDNTEDVSNPFL